MGVYTYDVRNQKHEFDTNETLFEKIATKINTLPEFLVKIGEDDELGTVTVENVLPDIFEKNDLQAEMKAVEKILDKFKSLDPVKVVEVFVLTQKFNNEPIIKAQVMWKFVNDIKEKYFSASDVLFLDVGNKKAYINSEDDLRNYYVGIQEDDTQSLKNKIKKRIADLKSIVEKREKTIHAFNSVVPMVSAKEPIVEQKLFEKKLVNLDRQVLSLSEVFNLVRTSNFVPYVAFGDFYKIHKSSPNYNWIDNPLNVPSLRRKDERQHARKGGDFDDMDEDNEVKFRKFIKICVLKRKFEPTLEQISSIDVSKYFSIALLEQRDDGFYMIFEHDIGQVHSNHVSYDVYAERALSVFRNVIGVNLDEEVVFEEVDDDKSDIRVVSQTVLYNTEFDKTIFSDLITTDPVFDLFLYLREQYQTVRDTYTVYYRSAADGEDCTVTLMQGEDIRYEFGKVPEMVKSVILKIKAQNMTITKRCISAMTKYFTMYDNKKDSIADFYKKLIPSFKIGNYVIKKTKLQLKDTLPDIFENTSRLCDPTKNATRIITKQEADLLPKAKKMLFPKDPKDGPQHYFTCKNDKLVPSLRDNPLPTSKLGLLPCCHQFKSDLFNEYYGLQNDEKKRDKPGTYQNLIKTDKFLDPGQFGELPDNLRLLLNYFSNFQNPEDKIYNVGRLGLGIRKSKSSFLECVLKAREIEIFDKDHPLPKDENERNKLVDEIIAKLRMILGKKARETGICAQEFYDYSPEEMEREIADVDVYLDPRKTLRLVEEHFKIKIYLFSKSKSDGFLEIPRHSHGHLQFTNPYKYTILIFDHHGSESDHSQYNRSELVARWIGGNYKDGIPVFKSDDQLIISIAHMYMELTRTFMMGKLVRSFILPQSFHSDLMKYPNSQIIKSQYIDTYGKCRCLYLKFDNKYTALYTSPMPPVNIRRVDLLPVYTAYQLDANAAYFSSRKKTPITRLSFVEAKELCQRYTLTIVSLGINTANEIEEVNCEFDQITFTISVEKTPLSTVDAQYPTISELNCTVDVQSPSLLQEFTENRKLSRYFLEYSYWLFSKYIDENKLPRRKISEKEVKKFFQDNTIIDERKVYTKIARTFQSSNLNNDILDKDGKLILPSIDARDSVIVALTIKANQNPDFLINFRKKKALQRYYQNTSEFNKMDRQVIMNDNFESLEKWSDNRSYEYALNYEQLNLSEPYFFTNENIEGGKVFLTRNADTFEEAFDIIKTFNSSGPTDEVDKFAFYFVKENNNVILFEKDDTDGHDGDTEYPKIMQYEKNIDLHSALLQIF